MYFRSSTSFLSTEGATNQRSRMVDEIVPVSAEQSSTLNGNEADYGAMIALDLWYHSHAHLDIGQEYWWKANLGQIICVHQVIDLWDNNGYWKRNWICSENDCECMIDETGCDSLTATVSTEEATSDLSSPPGCVYGDAVKITGPERFYLFEVAVREKPESGCTTFDATWENVVTVQALPVSHGETLTLTCFEGYTNLEELESTATCLYGQIVPEEKLPNCRLMRERVPGEITPASAVQSATFNDDVVHHGAELAIDMDLETANIANPTTDTPSPWLKLTLDKVYCVERVIIYDSSGSTLITWTCSEDECDICTETQSHCNSYSLTVRTEGAAPYLSSISDCRFGDTVKVESNSAFGVNEMAIIEKQGADCTNLEQIHQTLPDLLPRSLSPRTRSNARQDQIWSNIATEPALPVVEETTLTLKCPGGYTNLGGDTATCLYGHIILTDKPPDCKGKYSTTNGKRLTRENRGKLNGLMIFLRLILFPNFFGESVTTQRGRMSDEIVPVSAEQSSIHSNNEPSYGPVLALDRNLNTHAYLGHDGPEYWWKANLGQIHCVYQVIELISGGQHHRRWTCLEDGCVCEMQACASLTATVSIDGAAPDSSPPTEYGCKNGNTVKIKSSSHFYLYEIAIIRKPAPDCTTIDATWDNVVTVPALPVSHGDTLTLSCLNGYTNLGGDTATSATCRYGKVVPTDKPPVCRGNY
ncbi:hypothetical protein ACHWQZ_G013686 [Mnemiopsis leidyi]